MMFWNTLLSGFMWATVAYALLLRFTGGSTPFHIGLAPRAQWISQIGWLRTERYWVCLIIILLVAVGVRLWQFGAIPGGFNQDGAMAAVDAKALAEYGTDRFGMSFPVHFTAWGYGQMSVLLSYLMLPFIKIFGLSEITARLPTLLVSLAGLLALYAFICNAFGRPAALIVSFLAAINPWHIMQSRWALDCNIFPHFLIIGCYLLHKGRDSKLCLHGAMLSFALCMYSYGIAFFTVPLFLLGTALYARFARILTTRDLLLGAGTYTLFSWPVWMVMVVNFLKLQTIHVGLVTIPFFPDSVRSRDILFFTDAWLPQLKENLNALGRTVFFQSPDLPWNALDNFGTQYQFSAPFVALGFVSVCVWLWQNRSRENTARSFGSAIVLAGLAIGLWTGLVINNVNVNRVNLIYYFLIILAGLGLAQVARWFKPALMLSGLAYPVFFCFFCAHYFGVWSTEIGDYFFKGMAQALHQAAMIDTPKYYITINHNKTLSETLTLFHHRIDARYFQGVNFPPDSKKLSAETIVGNKYGTSYANRYIYIDPANVRIDPEEKAVYIVTSEEETFFDRARFNITSYKGFSLAVPNSL